MAETVRRSLEPAAQGDATRELIMETCEQLVAEQGFAVTVRAVTAAAGVNLAAVNYHFGSKDALLEAILMRRAEEVGRARLALLQEAGPDPDLPAVLYALLAPTVRWRGEAGGRAATIRFFARARTEGPPRLRALMNAQSDVLARFTAAIARARPQMSAADISWRLFFTLGAEHEFLAAPERLEAMSGGAADTSDAEAALERLIAFVLAGFDAD